MKYINILFITPVFYVFSCNANEITSDAVHYKKFISCVSKGDSICLNKIPKNIINLDFDKSIMLRDALAHSIIKSPLETIEALHRIDKTDHSFIRDNYGTDTVCGYMIDSNKYDRASFFKYYSIAKLNLEKIGNKGKACLDLMNSSIEETIYEEKWGKMKWGVEKYVF